MFAGTLRHSGTVSVGEGDLERLTLHADLGVDDGSHDLLPCVSESVELGEEEARRRRIDSAVMSHSRLGHRRYLWL